MNNVQLIGRLTRDVDMRYTQGENQTAIGRFTIAVDRPKKQDGTHETDFIDCFAWGKKAEVISQYFFKGSKIGVVGRIRIGSYINKDNQKVKTFEIEVTDIDFIDPKDTQPNPTTPEYNMQQGQQYYQQPQTTAPQQSSARSSTRSRQSAQSSGRSSAQPTRQASRTQQVSPQVAAEGGYMNIPDGVDDEGLPF